MAVNKVVYGTTVLVDLTGDTVTADKLLQGYTAHDKSGALITGTASATGGVTQDQDGYLVLDDDAPSSGGGLEYETGTWTPASDISSQWITFANSHTEAPFYYAVFDATGTYDSTLSSNYMIKFLDVNKLSGNPYYVSSTSVVYARYFTVYRSTSETSLSTSGGNIGTQDSNYYATNEQINATTSSSSRYWRAGRTYKWIAVWTPTS